jgi:hypothetical protein
LGQTQRNFITRHGNEAVEIGVKFPSGANLLCFGSVIRLCSVRAFEFEGEKQNVMIGFKGSHYPKDFIL